MIDRVAAPPVGIDGANQSRKIGMRLEYRVGEDRDMRPAPAAIRPCRRRMAWRSSASAAVERLREARRAVLRPGSLRIVAPIGSLGQHRLHDVTASDPNNPRPPSPKRPNSTAWLKSRSHAVNSNGATLSRSMRKSHCSEQIERLRATARPPGRSGSSAAPSVWPQRQRIGLDRGTRRRGLHRSRRRAESLIRSARSGQIPIAADEIGIAVGHDLVVGADKTPRGRVLSALGSASNGMKPCPIIVAGPARRRHPAFALFADRHQTRRDKADRAAVIGVDDVLHRPDEVAPRLRGSSSSRWRDWRPTTPRRCGPAAAERSRTMPAHSRDRLCRSAATSDRTGPCRVARTIKVDRRGAAHDDLLVSGVERQRCRRGVR